MKCVLVRVQQEKWDSQPGGVRGTSKVGEIPEETREGRSLETGGLELWEGCLARALASPVGDSVTRGPLFLHQASLGRPHQRFGSLLGAALEVCLPGTGHTKVWSRVSRKRGVEG